MDEPILSLAADEIASVESFRRLKDTAVLTIMFTDIEGFTRMTDERGERHSAEVRRVHDELVEGAITRGSAGLVVKRIGDAVMAVFSEPSTAIERALEIQAGLAGLDRAHPERDPLRVRIGLDMGQVAVEERVDVDVFGRHVNRASRIEGLAAGGQIFMSYTVFDSARGWLTGGSRPCEWASHGRYRLKGISGPVEVFEVVDPALAHPTPPRGGDRVRAVPGAAWAAGFVLLGIAGTVGYLRIQRTEVWLTDYGIPRSYLDGSTEVVLEGEDGQESRRLLADVGPGTHVLHYDVADAVRYYATLQVERGENRMRPEWMESRIPSLYRYIGLGDYPVTATRTGSYFVYDANNERVDHQATISIGIDLAPGEADPGITMRSTLSWSLVLDGTSVADETRSFDTPVEGGDEVREEVELFRDDFHRYWVEIRFVRRFAHLGLNAAFEPLRF